LSADGKGGPSFSSSIPKQHGAWSILIACFILGTFVGGSFGVNGAVLLVSVIFGYMARHAWNVYLRQTKDKRRKRGALGWSLMYSLISLGGGTYLLFVAGLWDILQFALLALVVGVMTLIFSRQKMEFTAGGEIAGIMGLTLAAPAAELVASGELSAQTVGLYVLCLFFFAGSVYHVRYLVRSKKATQGPAEERLKHGLPSIIYHVLILAIVVLGSTVLQWFPPLAPVALIPVVMKALWTVGHRYVKPLQVRQIGYREVAHTVIFVVIAGLAYYLG
jgi:CHASE2 domain-containing sensor protein